MKVFDVLAGSLLAIASAIYIWQRLVRARADALQSRRAAARFVWVDDTGAVRAITPGEAARLDAVIDPREGPGPDFPWIKPSLEARDSDGKLQGFLPMHRLPAHYLPVQSQQTAPATRVRPWMPLGLAFAQFPWVAVLILPMMGVGQSRPVDHSPAQMHAISVLAMLPALAGLAVGGWIILRRQFLSNAAWTVLALGLVVCLAWVIAFGSELV